MHYNIENKSVELSVGELCSFVYGRDSIGSRGYYEDDLSSRAQAGKNIHKKLQSEGGEEYHSEVLLSNTSKYTYGNTEFYFYVNGRADGIICRNGEYIVDEIKTVTKKAMFFSAPPIHEAQLYCYAYFLCKTKGLNHVLTRLTYYNLETGEISRIEKEFSVNRLKEYYENMLSLVAFRASLLFEKYEERMPTQKSAIFPYKELRPEQGEMIKECYRDIKHRSRLFCQAPTGIGKTISTLYPAVRCIGEGIGEKIFYLTSKSSIKKEALNAACKIREAGAKIRTVVINSKESMCLCESAKLSGGRLSSNCNPMMCPYADKYYRKREAALREIIDSTFEYNPLLIKEIATKFCICPHEFSLDISELCDVIICDYNYIMSPSAYLRRYFDSEEDLTDKYIFLFDEAHNLPSRARELFSCTLSSDEFDYLIKISKDFGEGALTEYFNDVSEHFPIFHKLCHDNERSDGEGKLSGYWISKEIPFEFGNKVDKLIKKLESWLFHSAESPVYFEIEKFLCDKLYAYRTVCECYDSRYVTFVKSYDGHVTVTLFCLDPSYLLSCALNRAVSSVLFSATLTPAEYFADILGGGSKSASVIFPSPFPKENFCIAVAGFVSTKFEDREKSYKKVAACIAGTVSAKAGNYMVFFPSYEYMEEVYKAFTEKYPKVFTVIQKKKMSYTDKDAFLNCFKDDVGKLRIGFCVLRGSFSEGIDLPGNRLIGSIVVGVGLPMLSDERNIIREYYDEKCGEGYDYAYTYPGMNSVLQAMGRVIRRPEDVGISVLIDSRYTEEKYKTLFLSSMDNVNFAGNVQNLAEIARNFWKNKK